MVMIVTSRARSLCDPTQQVFINTRTLPMELQIPGIPMVMIVTSRARSLCDPTQQDFINTRTLPIYKCHTRFKF